MFGFGNLKTLAAAAVLVMAAGVASAATCVVAKPAVTYTVTQGLPDALNKGSFCQAGNDKNNLDTFVWTLGDSTDTIGANFTISLSGQNWSILNPLGYRGSSVLLTFNHSKTFAGFLLDLTKPLTGIWNTTGSVDDLSHASVWYRGSPPAPIPLPAAGFLLLGALGGLAALRRRRRAA